MNRVEGIISTINEMYEEGAITLATKNELIKITNTDVSVNESIDGYDFIRNDTLINVNGMNVSGINVDSHLLRQGCREIRMYFDSNLFSKLNPDSKYGLISTFSKKWITSIEMAKLTKKIIPNHVNILLIHLSDMPLAYITYPKAFSKKIPIDDLKYEILDDRLKGGLFENKLKDISMKNRELYIKKQEKRGKNK